MRTGDQVVQDLPWKWGVQGKIFLIGGLGYMFDAWDVTLNGFLTPLLGTAFHLSTGQKGLVATANLIGLAAGAIAWGTVADRLGRKRAFGLTLLVFALFSALGALAPNFGVFLALRFIAGLGLGGCIPVDYALVSEFCPKKQRGKVLTAMDGWWPIGGTLCGLVATALLPLHDSWRWMLVVMILPAVLLVWLRRGVPESPIYLARTGREAEARAVIDDLVARTGAAREEYVIPAVTARRTSGGGLAAAASQLRQVWAVSPSLTGMVWLLFCTVLLVYYAALSWMPTILRAQGLGDYAAFTGTTAMTAIGVVGVLASVAVVEKTGRKWAIGLSAPLAAAALVAFALTLRVPAAALAMIVVFGFLIEITIPVLYAYVSELYPTELRASGFGWASSASRVVTGFTPLIFGNLLWPVLGLPLTFAVLAAVVLLAVVWMAAVGPETRGRELDRIGPAAVPAVAADSATVQA